MPRNACLRTLLRKGLSIAAVFLLLFFLSERLSAGRQAYAAAGINKVVHFQGKVLNSNGTNVTDGTYDFVFKLYDGAGSAATTLFTESWTGAALFSGTMTTAPGAGGESLVYSGDTNEATWKVGQILWNTTKAEAVIITSVNTSTNTLGISPTAQAWATSDTVTNKIYVKDGVFRVAVNSLNQNISGVNFGTDSIFLGVNFNADGEMKPRIQYTASPYAFNSEKVNGLTVTNTSDAAFASTTTLKIADGKTVVINNGLTFSGTDTTTFTFPSGSGTVVTLDATQTLTSKTIGSTGLTFSGATTDITTGTDEHLSLMPNGLGNVGIGTTAPIGLLNISGDVGWPSLVKINQASAVGDVFTASVSGTTRFVIKNDGNVGIGTNLPSTQLHITGDFTLGGGDLTGSNAEAIDIGEADNGSIILTASGETNNEELEIDLETNTYPTLTTSTATIIGLDEDLEFVGAQSITTSTGDLTINSAGSIVLTDFTTCTALETIANVLTCGTDEGGAGGSGTWTVANGAIFPNQATVLDVLVGGTASTSADFGIINVNGSGAVTATTSGHMAFTGAATAHKVNILDNGTLDFFRSPGGDSGAGTSSQLFLAANGNIGFNGITSSTAQFYFEANVAAQSTLTLGVDGSRNGILKFFSSTSGNTAQISNDSSGNLTITAATSGSVIVGDGSGNISIEPGSDNAIVNLASTGDFLIQDNGTTYAIFDDTGNIGIGTTAPIGKMHVEGDIGWPALVKFNNTSSVGDTFTASKSGTTQFVIKNDGNVGIGTILPAGKLNVSGAAVGKALVQLNEQGNQDIFTASGSGTTVFRVGRTGSIDIGTNNPAAARTINIGNGGSNTGGIESIFIGNGTSTNATNHTRIYIGNASNSTRVVFRVFSGVCGTCLQDNGQFVIGHNGGTAATSGRIWIRAASTNFRFNSVGLNADYSEYLQQEETSEPGDVMVFSSSQEDSVKQSHKPYDSQVLGVVTGEYGTGYNNDGDYDPEGGRANNPKWANVGMLGHAYVKVTTENGNIKQGDPLTSSSQKGKAMKATKAGRILGYALEAYDGTQKTEKPSFFYWERPSPHAIVALIQAGWYDPGAPPPDYVQNLQIAKKDGSDYGLTDASGRSWDNALVAKEGAVANLKVGGLEVQKLKVQESFDLTRLEVAEDAHVRGALYTDAILANRMEGVELTSERVTTKELTTDLIRSLSGEAVALQLTKDGQFLIKDEAGNSAIRFDSKGNAFFAGTLEAEKIKAQQIEGLELIESGIKNYEARIQALESLVGSPSAVILGSEATPGSDSAHASNAASPGTVWNPASQSEFDRLMAESYALLADSASDSAVITAGLTVEGNVIIEKDIRVKEDGLFEGMLSVIDALTTRHLFVSGLAQFFSEVIFKDKVQFAGQVVFNSDTAGYVVVNKGQKVVDVFFDKEYEQPPVIQAQVISDPLTDEQFAEKVQTGTCEASAGIDACQDRLDSALANADIRFLITKKSKKGFTILLKKTMPYDITLSWTALSVKDRKAQEKEDELEKKASLLMNNLVGTSNSP